MNTSPQQLVDHLFRHESGKMIAVLTRIFGMHHLEMAEDVVQEAFLKAIQTWTYEHLPPNPAAWLMQTARNAAIDILRRQQYSREYSTETARQLLLEENKMEQFFSEQEISDSQLQMIFACCHPSLNEEEQIALTLKTVSGFGVAEIARACMTSEAAIQKRLYRSRQFLKNNKVQLEIPAGGELNKRLETVYTILYLLFNEGYNSLNAEELIRHDLCAEAMRLCLLLSENKAGKQPASFALLALMCFQASRFDSRLDENNSIILLEQQDRSKWDRELIRLGYAYLNRSSEGDHISIYHIESAIAAEHALAASFGQTNWTRLLQLYDLLVLMKKTPIVLLNRAIVLSQMGETKKAIEEILQIEGIDKLIASAYIYGAVLGELYWKDGNALQAQKLLRNSLELTTSGPEKKLLSEKLEAILNSLTLI